MRRVPLLFAVFVLWASMVGAQTKPQITGADTTLAGQELKLGVTGITIPDLNVPEGFKAVIAWANKIQVLVDSPANKTAVVESDVAFNLGSGGVKLRLFFNAPEDGVYVLVLSDANQNPPLLTLKRITVGSSPTPGPGPGPNPPPGPSPMPLMGLRVLILEETSQRSELPASQLSVLTSTEIRGYLNSKCVRASAGPEFRFFDVDTDLSPQEKHWQDVVKRPRASLPWLIISTGTSGYEGPLPKTIPETLELLKKYGG